MYDSRIWWSGCLTHWGRDKSAPIFADNIFICIFLNENFLISNETSLNYVICGLIDNKPSLVRTGDKPLAEPMIGMVCWPMRHLVSVS